MKTDISNLSLKELTELKDNIETHIEKKKEEEKETLIKKIKELAQESSISLDFIADEIRSKKSKKKKQATAKYKNPGNDKEIWSGRGRKPAWLEQAIKDGKKIEDFLISKKNQK